jgi:hypothetical protein
MLKPELAGNPVGNMKRNVCTASQKPTWGKGRNGLFLKVPVVRNVPVKTVSRRW